MLICIRFDCILCNATDNKINNDLYWGNFFLKNGFQKGPQRSSLKYNKKKKRNYN